MTAIVVHVARGYKRCVRVNNWGTISPEGGRNVLYRIGCPRGQLVLGLNVRGDIISSGDNLSSDTRPIISAYLHVATYLPTSRSNIRTSPLFTHSLRWRGSAWLCAVQSSPAEGKALQF